MTHKKTDEGYPIFRSYLETENDEPYYSMNTLSFYYEDMERKQKLIEDLAKAIVGYDHTLTGNLAAIEQQVAERFEQWDEKLKTFDGSVMDLLQEWVDDGTMDHIVDSSIVDRKLAPITTQLAETEEKIGTQASFKGRKPRTLVSFVTDDASVEDYTVFKDIFARQQVPCVTAVVADYVDKLSNYCTSDQLLELQNDYGWEIMSHTKTHANLPTISDSALVSELKTSNELINAMGLKSESLAVPYGAYNDKVRLAASKYYRSVRQSGVNYEGGEIAPIDTYGMRGVWMANNSNPNSKVGFSQDNIEYYKWFIDRAYENNAWLIISTHSWEIKAWGWESLLEELIEYAKTKAEIVTFKQALDRMENVVESGINDKSQRYEKEANYHKDHFSLGADGTVSSLQVNTLRVLNNAILPTTPPADFKSATMTFCSIMTTGAQGFPENKAGMLITYKFSQYIGDYGFYYQTYKIYGMNTMYIRTAINANSWNAWEKTNGASGGDSLVVLNDVPTGASYPTGFTENKITITQVSGGTPAANMPLSSAGLLQTFRFTTKDGMLFTHQIARPVNSSISYTRYAINATTWSAWESDVERDAIQFKSVNSFNGLTPITSFQVNKITYNTISTASADSGLPVQSGGILTTHRLSAAENGYNYQTYRKYGSNEMWTRWAISNTTWGAWSKIAVVQ